MCLSINLCNSEVAVAGKDDRLGARPHAEFVEEVGHVIADGLFADGKALRNLRVAKAFCNQRQDLSLARGERGERGVFASTLAFKPKELPRLIAEALPGRFVLE